MPVRVHRDQRAFLELGASCPKGTHDRAANGYRENVLLPTLDHSWLASLSPSFTRDPLHSKAAIP